jgi:hypothetical protein
MYDNNKAVGHGYVLENNVFVYKLLIYCTYIGQQVNSQHKALYSEFPCFSIVHRYVRYFLIFCSGCMPDTDIWVVLSDVLRLSCNDRHSLFVSMKLRT